MKSYQSEETNYAFSPRPSKKKRELGRADSVKVASSMTVDEEFESRKLKEPTHSFDARYLASAWNDRHASPSRKPRIQKSSHGDMFEDKDDIGFLPNVFGM